MKNPIIKPKQFNEQDVLRSLMRDSFYDFVREMWSEVIAEKPVWSWYIKPICDELQTIAERVFDGVPSPYDFICNQPPATTKSTIFSIMFPPWVWTRMPSARFICASNALDLGLDLSRKCRDVVRSRAYTATFPEITWRDDQNVKGYFVNNAGGFRYVATVGGRSPIGFHGHFLLVDDPIDPMSAVSDADIKTANDWLDGTLPSRKVEKELVPIIMVMQRLAQNDPTGHRLNNKAMGKVKHFCFPAELCKDVKPREYRKCYKNGLLDPVRLTAKRLKKERARGSFIYSGQFMQNPIPLGGGMFKTQHLRIEDLHKDIQWACMVRYWDKAATEGGGAFTVGVLMGLDKKGRFWVLDVVRGQWDSSQREGVICQTALMDGKNVVIGIEQEPGGGGKESAESTVSRLAGFIVVVQRATVNKALRADPFSVQVNARNVTMKKAEWNFDFLNELKFFPNSTYKDQTDASSGAFTVLTSLPASFAGYEGQDDLDIVDEILM